MPRDVITKTQRAVLDREVAAIRSQRRQDSARRRPKPIEPLSLTGSEVRAALRHQENGLNPFAAAAEVLRERNAPEAARLAEADLPEFVRYCRLHRFLHPRDVLDRFVGGAPQRPPISRYGRSSTGGLTREQALKLASLALKHLSIGSGDLPQVARNRGWL